MFPCLTDLSLWGQDWRSWGGWRQGRQGEGPGEEAEPGSHPFLQVRSYAYFLIYFFNRHLFSVYQLKPGSTFYACIHSALSPPVFDSQTEPEVGLPILQINKQSPFGS